MENASEVNHDAVRNFLITAISDAQATIKSLDTKANILLALLIIPVAKLNTIASFITSEIQQTHYLRGVVLLLTASLVTLWILAFTALAKTLIAIDNPNHHITGKIPSGLFYSGSLFKIGRSDVFLNQTISSSKSFEEFSDCFNLTSQEINKELQLEAMKLAYIRSIKITRVRAAYLFGMLWVAGSGILWALFQF